MIGPARRPVGRGAFGGNPVVSRTRRGDAGDWLWFGGGNPVVSLVDSLNRRLQAGTPRGVRVCEEGWIPVVSLRSTTGYKPSSLRDEVTTA